MDKFKLWDETSPLAIVIREPWNYTDEEFDNAVKDRERFCS